MPAYANVIVPLPLASSFTYVVPEGMEVRVGSMVVVPFGRSKSLTAIVVRVSQEPPAAAVQLKPIIRVADARLVETQVRLIEFVSSYYITPPGEAALAVLPPGLLARSGPADEYKPLNRTEYKPTVSPAELETALVALRRAPRQAEALRAIVAGADPMTFDSAIRRALVNRGLLSRRDIEVSRIDTGSVPAAVPVVLTPQQQQALHSINEQHATKTTVLLHGVTSSGKTEIYIHLIKQHIDRGGRVLYLVPENGLTQHLYNRLKAYFGSQMGLYHAQCSTRERMETYLKQQSDAPFPLILGTKGALFLPNDGLTLIVVDEEHDRGYKQTERTPHYNARDMAIALAGMTRARVLLGSATPSVESYANHVNGKYGYVRLAERYGGSGLPQLHIADLREDRRKKRLRGHFTRLLIAQIEAALAAHRQVILFQDRLGYSPYVQCSECGYIPRCPHCGVTLTYSRATAKLTCRYCGHSEPYTVTCPQCKAATVEPRGLGVEQLEAETHELFPAARTALVTATNMDTVMRDFADGRYDILIGTRRIVKGIDYRNVTVLGVMDVDAIMLNPDFRATEQAYQLLLQAAGRTGRARAEGHLVLQTRQADNPFLHSLNEAETEAFYNDQMAERQLFCYPPFCRLIRVTVSHTNCAFALGAAGFISENLSSIDPKVEVSPPIEPLVAVRAGNHYREVLIKLKPGADIARVKLHLVSLIQTLRRDKGYETGTYAVDVDPL